MALVTAVPEPDQPGGPAPGRSLRAARRRGQRAAEAGSVSGAWKALAAVTGDFEPDDDAHLLAWMRGEAIGMSAYAEAVTDAHETAVTIVGLDPVAMAALHDYAEAAAQAAEAMAAARQRFAAHYREVREFAAAGGVLPYEGRWMTGEGG
jgi:hypothetical protein